MEKKKKQLTRMIILNVTWTMKEEEEDKQNGEWWTMIAIRLANE